MDWHGEKRGRNDSLQAELDPGDVSAAELTEFINGPYAMVQNKEQSGVTFRFFPRHNEGIEVPLSTRPNTTVKREGEEV